MAQNGAAGAAGFPPGGIDLSALQNVLNVSGLAAILACRSCFGTERRLPGACITQPISVFGAC